MRAAVVEWAALCGKPGEERSRLALIRVLRRGARPSVAFGGPGPGARKVRPPARVAVVAPETAPATRDTVQVDFHEELPDEVQGFGLVKLRARVPWREDGRHVLLFHRQMPTGWPEAPHVVGGRERALGAHGHGDRTGAGVPRRAGPDGRPHEGLQGRRARIGRRPSAGCPRWRGPGRTETRRCRPPCRQGRRPDAKGRGRRRVDWGQPH